MMKKLLVLLLLVLMGGGGGGGNGRGGDCCDDHGGFAVCGYGLNAISGYIQWDDHGHVTCNDKTADGYNYQCPDECK